MAGFQSINTGGRSTSSYEEDDDEFSSYDPETAGSRTRRGGGFSALDASAYEARRQKCKRIACVSVALTLLVAALAFAYNAYQGGSPGSWTSDASANYNSNYTPSYGAPAEGEGQDEGSAPPAEGVPPMPTVDLMGLCNEEYLELHGNKKCKENCIAGACCFLDSVDDNCNHLDGADVVCNMYASASCKDVMGQPDTEGAEPEDTYYEDIKEIENLYYGGNEYGSYNETEGEGLDIYGYGQDEFDMDGDDDEYDDDDYDYDEYGVKEGGDEYDEYGTGKGGDEYDNYGYGGYDSKEPYPEVTIDGGEMPVDVTAPEDDEGTTDFEHDFDGTLDSEAPTTVCGRLDVVTNEQSCSDTLFCEDDDDCTDPDYPMCMEGCGDEFEDAMEEIMEAVEESLPPELKSYCASSLGEDGKPFGCDATSECLGDEDCPDGFCSPDCGAVLYEDSEGDEALGVCGVSSSDGMPSCSPDGLPCFNNEDCENNSSDGTYVECLIECNTEIMEDIEEDLGDSSEESETEAEVEAEAEALTEAIEEYYAEETEYPESEEEVNEEIENVMQTIEEMAEEETEEEPTTETEESYYETIEDYSEGEGFDEGDASDEVDSEIIVEQEVPLEDVEELQLEGLPGGMPASENFEGELPEEVVGFCGRIRGNGDVVCTGEECKDDTACTGKEEKCLSECAPTRN